MGTVPQKKLEGQDWFINALKAVGFPGNEEGMCYGLSHVYMDYVLKYGLDKFEKRLNRIYNKSHNRSGEEDLTYFKKLGKKYMSGDPDKRLTEDEFEIIAFFEAIELYMRVEKHPELFEEGDAPYVQSGKAAYRLLAGSDVNAIQPITVSGVYTKEELETALDVLAATLNEKNIRGPIVFIVNGKDHATSVSYFPEKKDFPWQYMDPNQLPGKNCSSSMELAEEIFEAHNSNQLIMEISLDLYADSSQKSNFGGFRQSLEFNEHWKKINEETPEKIENCKKIDCSLLRAAIYSDNAEEVESVLKRTKITAHTVDKRGRTPLMSAVRRGYLEVVNKVLESSETKIDINEKDNKGNTPLHEAINKGNIAIIKKLLISKADVNILNKKGNTPLHLAIEHKNERAIKMLLEKNPNMDITNDEGNTPLHVAVKKGDANMLKLLLEKNPNMDITNDEGDTPLHIAVKKGDANMLKLLLEKNPNMDIKNNKGNTPLHVAVKNSDTHILSLLLEKNPNMDIKNNKGDTPLHVAVEECDPNMLELLLEKNPKMDIKNNKGNTPLQVVVKKGDANMLKLLLEKNPNMDITNDEKQSVLELAISTKKPEIIKLVEDNMKLNETHGKELNQEPQEFYKPLKNAAEESKNSILAFLKNIGASIANFVRENFQNFKSLFCSAKKENEKTVENEEQNSHGVNPRAD